MLNLPEEISLQEKSKVGSITLRKDSIITFEPIPGVHTHTIESMKHELDIFKTWAGENRLGFLSDNKNLKKFDAEIRVYAQQNLPLFCSKFAIIVASGISSFLTNIFIHINRPEIPVKAFSNKQDALNWLKSK